MIRNTRYEDRKARAGIRQMVSSGASIEAAASAYGVTVDLAEKIVERRRGRDLPPARVSFLARVDKSGGPNACWPWMGACNWAGYGHHNLRQLPRRSHRAAWFLANGEIPSGVCVLHKCDNPPCCNPDHLFLGTPADNAADRASKARNGPRPTGENNRMSKLTARKVLEARRMASDGITQDKIAASLGVSQATIWSVLSGKTWRHVQCI